MRRNTLREGTGDSLFTGVNTGGGKQEMPPAAPPGTSPIEHEYDVYVESDRITFIKKTPGETDVPDEKTTPAASEQDAAPPSAQSPYLFLLHAMLLLCEFLCLDGADMLFTLTVTITLLLIVQRDTLQDDITLGRLQEPLTLSESKTVPATGHEHQSAAAARGTVTFYNCRRRAQGETRDQHERGAAWPAAAGRTAASHALPPAVAADRAIGQEASRVQLTVSETCQAVAYDRQELVRRADKLLASQAMKALGQGYARYGDVSFSVTQADAREQTATFAFLAQGTWACQIDPARMTRLVRGQPRLAALRMLTRLAGVARASVSGVEGDQALPTDVTHIHLFVPGIIDQPVGICRLLPIIDAIARNACLQDKIRVASYRIKGIILYGPQTCKDAGEVRLCEMIGDQKAACLFA